MKLSEILEVVSKCYVIWTPRGTSLVTGQRLTGFLHMDDGSEFVSEVINSLFRGKGKISLDVRKCSTERRALSRVSHVDRGGA